MNHKPPPVVEVVEDYVVVWSMETPPPIRVQWSEVDDAEMWTFAPFGSISITESK